MKVKQLDRNFILKQDLISRMEKNQFQKERYYEKIYVKHILVLLVYL